MARSCAICGKVSMGGFNPQSSGMNRVRAHRRMQPNLQPLVIDAEGHADQDARLHPLPAHAAQVGQVEPERRRSRRPRLAGAFPLRPSRVGGRFVVSCPIEPARHSRRSALRGRTRRGQLGDPSPARDPSGVRRSSTSRPCLTSAPSQLVVFAGEDRARSRPADARRAASFGLRRRGSNPPLEREPGRVPAGRPPISAVAIPSASSTSSDSSVDDQPSSRSVESASREITEPGRGSRLGRLRDRADGSA